MNKEFRIKILEPCSEDWKNMSPNEKGRFCMSCSKTVIDFSKKTNEEIQIYFAKHYNDKVCGRFLKTQLDSTVIELPIQIINKPLSFQKLFILALLLVMGSSLFSCNLSNGKSSNIKEIVIIDSTYTPAKRIDQKLLNALLDSMLDDPITIEEIESLHNSQDDYIYLGRISLIEKKFLTPNPNFDLNKIVEIEEDEEIEEFIPKPSTD